MDNDKEYKLPMSSFIITSPQTDENVLTMAFVNMQPITEIYTSDQALENGTLFKNIDKPFVGRNTQC